MSLRMMEDVLRARDINSHCPVCGRAALRYPHTEEHIIPLWLQQKHNLLNKRLTIPNFIDKRYKSVKIGICACCNNERLGKIEARVAPVFASADPFGALSSIDVCTMALWICKIHWLLGRKSNSAIDFRTRGKPKPDRILPDELLPGLLYSGMILRSFLTGKRMVACFLDDPPIPEFYYGFPFSLYCYRITERDRRIENFDLLNNSAFSALALRSGSIGLICLFDGGLHRHFLQERYVYLRDEPLHPKQFTELFAQMVYDQTVLIDNASQVTYYWSATLRAVVAQNMCSRWINPYRDENHDPARMANIVGFYTAQDPESILTADGRFFTSLKRLDGSFLPFAVTDEELEAARRDPTMQLRPPADPSIRRKLFDG